MQSQQRPDFPANHLDTGFAIIFRDQTHLECLVHDQMIDPKGSGMTVFKMTYEHEHLCVEPQRDLKSALQKVAELRGTQVTLIPCGGKREVTEGKVLHRIRQEREWHNQAVNVLVIGSGKIVAFGRNHGTIEALKLNGYELWSAAEFLTWAPQQVDNWMASASKGIITVRDGELSRAHGGPRSLVFPLRRD
jgi:arginine deiminase